MNHYPLIRRTGALPMLVNLAFMALAALCSLSWLTTPSEAITRTWNGASNGYWSEPSNWSPVGAPQNGDDLIFNNPPRSNLTNDIFGLSVRTLQFNHSGAVWGPGSLTVTVGISEFSADDGPTALNIPFLDLDGNISITSNDGTGWGYILNCTTRLNGHTLTVYAANSGSVSFQNPIIGTGQINFASGTNYMVFLSGSAGSAPVEVSSGDLILASITGPAIVGSLHIDSGAAVELHADNMIDPASPVIIEAGAKLLLDDHNCYFSNLEMRGGLLDSGPGGAAIFQEGPFNFNTTTETAVLAGRVHGLTISNRIPALSVNGPFSPSLDVQANLGGEFIKAGIGYARLLGPNSFSHLVLQQGVVEADHNASLSTNSLVQMTGGALSLRSVNISGVALTVYSAASLQPDGRYGCLLTCLNTCSWDGPILLTTNLFVFVSGDLTLPGLIYGDAGISFWSGTAHLTGSDPNMMKGTLISRCELLELDKSLGSHAYAGPLVVGGGSGGPYEVRWLQSYQNPGATLTLYANGIVNLNNNNEDFGSVTFNGGEVDTGTGQFAIYAPLTVNASPSSAVINGYLGLPPGTNRVFVVNDGEADCDLLVNAVVFGSPNYFVKRGAGTMCLVNANTYDAVTLLQQGILDIGNGASLGTWPGLVISDGATLRVSGAGTGGGFEAVGAGVGGTHGAIEVLPNASFSFSGGMLLDGPTILDVGQSAGLALNGAISSSGPGCSLIKNGSGVLTLSGSSANSYSGDTIINAGGCLLSKTGNQVAVPGKLIIGPAPPAPTVYTRLLQSGGIGSGMVVVNANSLLDVNGFNLTLNQLTLNDGGSVQTGGGTLSLADGSSVNVGSLSGLGSHATATIGGFVSLPVGNTTFNVSPAASTPPLLFGPELDVPARLSGGSSISLTVMDKYGLGQMQLRGNNNYFNQTRVYEGTVLAASANALGSSSGATYIYNNASLALDGGISVPGEFVLLDSTNKAALDSRSGANSWGGTVYLNRNSSINVNNALALNGVVDGPGSLLEVGPGSLTLGGSSGNSLTGEVLVNQGTLLLNKPTAVTAIPGALEIGSDNGGPSAVARNLGSYQILGNIYVHSTGLYDINGQQENTDALVLYGNGTVQTGAGYLSLKTGAPIYVFPGTNTTATINGNIVMDPGNHVFMVNSGAPAPGVQDLVVNAVMSQFSTASSIQKEGAGRMRLTANNTYTGPTTLNAGTLQVDGSQPQSAVTLSNATLQGSGTIGAVNITGTSGIIAPGAGLGILTCANFNPGAGGSATLQVELNGTLPGFGYDQLNAQGTVRLTGVKLSPALGYASSVDDQFTIINNDGGDAVIGTFTGLPQGTNFYIGGELFQIDYSGGTGNDVVLTRLITPPKPVLTIERVPPRSVRLLWATNDPAYVLQSETDPTAINWAVVSTPPVIVGNNYVVTNSTSVTSKFYRLAK